MTIISSISTALDSVRFSSRLDAFSFPLESFGYPNIFSNNYSYSSSTVTVTIAILVTSYYVFTNVLHLDKPKGYRDIPALSSWKTIYYQFRSLPTHVKYARAMKDVHEKYGISRVNQFGVDIVHLASPEYAHQMLTHPDIFPKLDLNTLQPNSLTARLFGYNVVLSNGEMWRHQRRVCNPAFHRSWSTEAFGERTNAMINKILSHLDDGTAAIDMGKIAKRMTLDALGKVAFDYDFKSIEDPNENVSSQYHTIMKDITSPLYFFFPSLENIPFFRRNKTRKAIEDFNGFLFGIIEAKREKLRLAAESGLESNDNDLLSLLIKANGEDALTDEELRANLFIFFIAGHDTTANVLACACYHIATNPEIQERLHAEVTGVLGPSDASNGTPVPTVDESKNMEFLNAIMKETMRISPSVEMLQSRVVATETTIGPYTLPAGVRVQVNINSIQNNPKYWDRPEVFNPDRFINNLKDGGISGKKDPAAWLPFSSGGRMCLGINFSLIEQRVVLSMLIHKFKFSIPADSPHKDGIKFSSKGLKTPKDLDVQFTPRY